MHFGLLHLLYNLLLVSDVTAHTTPSWLIARSDCTTHVVASGDSCATLASKCGVSSQNFNRYNTNPKLCATLAPGQRVCCSPGTLPDITPKSSSNGSCASYTVRPGDTCSSIAAANGLTANSLATFNDKTTWGWAGCDQLTAELTMCLSTGSPPMPQPIRNAVCGPQKPGSEPPGEDQALADLNACPLNSCCTVWGQCGITPEYCTNGTGHTGNPGTAPTGQNGCISNCGTEIANGKVGPSSFISVAYYESWNFDRSCLNMRVDSIDPAAYTHLHWGFATVSSSYNVSVTDTFDQWPAFTALQGVKKIVSIGGWGFSTDASTYNVLRKAMDPSNVHTFVNNIIDFLETNSLDGVDIDWEYPGAPDIPGIPGGLSTDAPNYLAFVKILREKLPQGTSLSIAAPASYWYLQQFPIANMSQVVDYIVYMTYDLHGQWDYGNKWSQDGCSTGSCLRSHVNLTETNYALAMVTKAGVPSTKIVVGISSYGRGFGMARSDCTGPMCNFNGPNSTATPGACTATAGYISNAEINMIIDSNDTGTSAWYDTDSNSNILVYGGNQWVAYMDDVTKGSRTSYYQSLNFLGTVDWAVDLQAFQDDDDGNPYGDDDEDLPLSQPLSACTDSYTTMEDLDAAAGSIPPECKVVYTVATLSNVLSAAVTNYTNMMYVHCFLRYSPEAGFCHSVFSLTRANRNDDYDKRFNTYAQSVSDSAGSGVREFVNDNGTNYFSCIVTEASWCCDKCKHQGDNNPCDYCFQGKCEKTIEEFFQLPTLGNTTIRTNDSSSEAPYSNSSFGDRSLVHRDESPRPHRVMVNKMVNVSEPCPPDYSKRGSGSLVGQSPDDYDQSVYWTLLPDKADQFYADLLSFTGVAEDKLVFDNYDRGNSCAPTAKPDDDCWGFGMDYGMPTPKGYGPADVANPKDVVQKALNNSDTLQQQISDVLDDLELDAYYGDGLQLVDSISIPVLMIADAVDGMAQVETVADKIDEEKKKALIMAFLSAILFLVPIAGEAVGTVAELSDVATTLTLAGAAGDTAMGVYTVVEDPKNPLLGIMSIVLAPLALTSATRVSEAADLRRGMSDEDLVKLGGKIGSRMQTVKKVIGSCSKAL